MKENVKIEFCGKDMNEIINKVIAFLNMFKGINLAESEERYEPRRKAGMAQKPSE